MLLSKGKTLARKPIPELARRALLNYLSCVPSVDGCETGETNRAATLRTSAG